MLNQLSWNPPPPERHRELGWSGQWPWHCCWRSRGSSSWPDHTYRRHCFGSILQKSRPLHLRPHSGFPSKSLKSPLFWWGPRFYRRCSPNEPPPRSGHRSNISRYCPTVSGERSDRPKRGCPQEHRPTAPVRSPERLHPPRLPCWRQNLPLPHPSPDSH